MKEIGKKARKKNVLPTLLRNRIFIEVMKMSKCSFCSSVMEKGTGKMVVQKTGKISWFCSKKCEKNLLKLKRDPRDFKWAQPKQ